MLIELALIQWWCAVRWQGREKHSKLILSGIHITHFRSPHFFSGCQKIEHNLWDAKHDHAALYDIHPGGLVSRYIAELFNDHLKTTTTFDSFGVAPSFYLSFKIVLSSRKKTYGDKKKVQKMRNFQGVLE